MVKDILNSQTSRTRGTDAQNSNIEAAKAVAEIVKSTLGPMGMDKMLIDSSGETVITNDGVKILKEMEIEHPGARILVEVAKTQETEVGDGTTSAVILAGELLSQAQKLLSQKIHPTNIVQGYKIAAKKTLEILEKCAISIDVKNKKALTDIAETAMTGKVADLSKEKLAELLFELCELIGEKEFIPKDKIKIIKISGGEIKDSNIIKGIVLDKNPANPNVPTKIKNSKILLVDFPLEIRELDNQAKININSVSEYEQFLSHEQSYLKSMAEKIKEIGANVVVCQKGIDDEIAYYLAKSGILCVRRARKSDIEKLSFALNNKIVSSYEDMIPENLGSAKLTEIKEMLGEKFIIISGCANPKAVTLMLKASTQHVLDELERAIDDAIGDLSSILKSKKIVAGGGAIELELHKELLKYAKTFDGKNQLIVNSFAESFLSIPKTLCNNCGLDEIESMTKLISMHEKGDKMAGINGFKGVVKDTIKEGIVEPINIKSQAIKSASESCSMLLRIDDIIAAKRLSLDENFNKTF